MKKLITVSIGIGLVLASAPAIASPMELTGVTQTFHESKAGQFCKKADVGKKKRADNGKRIKCKMVNGRARWVNY